MGSLNKTFRFRTLKKSYVRQGIHTFQERDQNFCQISSQIWHFGRRGLEKYYIKASPQTYLSSRLSLPKILFQKSNEKKIFILTLQTLISFRFLGFSLLGSDLFPMVLWKHSSSLCYTFKHVTKSDRQKWKLCTIPEKKLEEINWGFSFISGSFFFFFWQIKRT